MARPKKKIDKELFEGLCSILCTEKEIMSVLNVSKQTLLNFCDKTYKKTFKEVYPDLIADKKIALRRLQWQAAESGNASMLIWLGKCWLGQDGTPDTEEPEEEKTNAENYEELRQSETFAEVRQNLVNQLETTGANTPAFLSLIDDYMEFWVIKEQLKDDIRQRGVYVPYNNGGGQTGTKENPSVAYQLKISSQMLKILQQLKLDIDNAGGAFDDEL